MKKISFNKNNIETIIWGILLLAFVFLFYKYQTKLINYTFWNDESETILVTKMMVTGQKLYTEIFNNHGPATFMLGYIISSFGDFDTQTYRIPMFILQWCALLSIYFSPIHSKSHLKRLASIAIIGAFWVKFLPIIYGHTYLYQTQSGLLLVIIFMQYALPIYFGKELNLFQKFIGPFLLVFVIFFAITNVPLVLLISLTTIRLKDKWMPWVAYLLAILINIGFLVQYGSIDGYVAYHIYLNSVILNDGSGLMGYINNIIVYYRDNFTNFMTLIWLMIVVFEISKRSSGLNILRSLMIIPMLVSLVIRGGYAFDLWGLIYLYVLSGLSMVFFIDRSEERIWDLWPLTITFVITFYSLNNYYSFDRYFWELPKSTPMSEIIKKITNKEDKILILTFNSVEYLMSDRLPASAHFFYLEMQAKYNQNPYKDVKTDLLVDIQSYQPKVIVMDEWSSTNTPFGVYAYDIYTYVMGNYYPIENTRIYVRNGIDISQTKISQ